mmetsp:Transcript_18798/g.21610  ORF Transcript_18798/g.21610 Transcript_18798/m.21610 type:complete len:130 (+) Transcript_18798:392-781(+)
MITFGIMFTSIVGFLVDGCDKSFYNEFIWRLLMGFPLVISLIQLYFLLFKFKLESPIFYNQNGNKVLELKAVELIYVNARAVLKEFERDELEATSIISQDQNQKVNALGDPKRLIDLLKNPYRGAFLVG